MEKLQSVLLVDDDPINNHINSRLLIKLDVSHSIEVLTNGKEALEYLRKIRLLKESCPELILLDINMPVMNGFDFLDSFGKEDLCQDMPLIIILTTSNNPIDINKIRNYPAVAGFLNKPLTEEKLQTLIDRYFD